MKNTSTQNINLTIFAALFSSVLPYALRPRNWKCDCYSRGNNKHNQRSISILEILARSFSDFCIWFFGRDRILHPREYISVIIFFNFDDKYIFMLLIEILHFYTILFYTVDQNREDNSFWAWSITMLALLLCSFLQLLK